MTTEVAIVNREAIALAADSAVTVDMVNGRKIYNSANKLFALSKHYPVGVMIYGGAKFSGVPWESLIKVYRQTHPSISFDYLRQYAVHFFDFLEKNKEYFLQADKEGEISRFSCAVCQRVRKKIIDAIELEFRQTESDLPRSKENQIIKDNILSSLKLYRSSEALTEFNSITLKSLQEEYLKVFQAAIDYVFEELNVTSENNNRLLKIICYAMKIRFFPTEACSGIVFAGFGQKEVIPDLVTYQVNLLLQGKVRKFYLEAKSHHNRPNPIIIPFAQEDVIFTFLTGISPDLESLSQYFLDAQSRQNFKLWLEEVKKTGKLSDSEVAALNASMEEKLGKLLNQHREEMQKAKQQLYIDDVLRIISVLPKEDLAEMAESLVSLTSVRRKISIAEETVGGPTDVALISKGDGFIWMKRKHYFEPKINTDFFARNNRFFGKGGKQ